MIYDVYPGQELRTSEPAAGGDAEGWGIVEDEVGTLDLLRRPTVTFAAKTPAVIRRIRRREWPRVTCILITGSTDGLGLAAARTLVDEGHTVVLHARNRARASDLSIEFGPIVIGDLSSADETRDLARQVNELGRMDAVIHNAGIYVRRPEPRRLRAMLGRSQSTRWRRTC